MIFPQDKTIGSIACSPSGPFTTGELVTLRFTFTVGKPGLPEGAQLRIGLPNTGWQQAVVPQLRYWDELISGSEQRFAPFHPVNTTGKIESSSQAVLHLEAMERMLLPDEDPAEAYWRWWITATIKDAPLSPQDRILLTYGDPRFIGQGARIQTFPENQLTLSVCVNPGTGTWVRPAGAPVELNVIAGPPVRANLVASSSSVPNPTLRVALTDACHCRPNGKAPESLVLRDTRWRRVGRVHFPQSTPPEVDLEKPSALIEGVALTNSKGDQVWGRSNPASAEHDGLQLFWGDLHAQSEYHSMHSQKKNTRQANWSKGISCGTPDDLYAYAREISLLDFIAITDQGGNTGTGWELLQQKAVENYEPGTFVTFKSYEAGSPIGHRNVYYRNADPEPPEDPDTFSYMPEFLYQHYKGRNDVILVPHHVKTWTDWSYHDPDLEPLMEIYSCWGQSENPSTKRWNKGMTPGAGAWEALRRGYKMGFIASSDNHVGMPGRSYPHDRQVHTPFPGGLAAIFAPELTREALFDALKNRRCYGTTGARIQLSFSINTCPMGSTYTQESPEAHREIVAWARGTDAIDRIELLRNGEVVHTETPRRAFEDTCQLTWKDVEILNQNAYYYVRVFQVDGEAAWSSPIWVNPS